MTRYLLPALFLFAAIVTSTAKADTLYTSATGTGTACTENSPCSPAALFDVTDPPFVPARTPNPGDIIEVAAGEYNFSSRYFMISTPNLTIQGPSGTRNAATHVPYFNFGPPAGAGFAASFAMLIDAPDTKIENITVDGARPNALVAVNGDPTITGTRVNQSKFINTSNASATTFLANNATISNSIFRYDGGSAFGRALEATGTVTGSLAYSLSGQAISLKGNLHPGSPGCSLDIQNTLSWGGGGNLNIDDNGSAPGDCNGLSVPIQNSWIPDPALPTPELGGGITSAGPLAVIIFGAGNLADTPSVFDPLDPGSTYLSNYELPATSPAVNAGCTTGCGTSDFYNRPRPIGSANDIGPFEATLVPSVSEGAVSSVTSSTANLSALINANGGETTYNFLIRKAGESTWSAVYGEVIPAGSNAPRAISAEANLLQPDTSYEVLLEAINSAGDTNLSGISFTTSPDNTPSLVVSRVKSKVSKKSVIITSRVRVSGAGTIKQRARDRRQKNWCKVSRRVNQANSYTLKCNLGKKGRRYLKQKPLRLSLQTFFTPTGSSQIENIRPLTLKRKP